MLSKVGPESCIAKALAGAYARAQGPNETCLQPRDLPQVVRAQRLKYHHVVQAVQELGTEVALDDLQPPHQPALSTACPPKHPCDAYRLQKRIKFETEKYVVSAQRSTYILWSGVRA